MIVFEWDPQKARANARKHGIAFDLATAVFNDPFAVTELDRIEGYEHRWRTVGLVGGVLVLVVAHAIREESENIEVYRIISARAAEPKERRDYERKQNRQKGV